MPKPAKRSHGTAGAAVRQQVGGTGGTGGASKIQLKETTLSLVHLTASTDSKCSFQLNLQRKCIMLITLLVFTHQKTESLNTISAANKIM